MVSPSRCVKDVVGIFDTPQCIEASLRRNAVVLLRPENTDSSTVQGWQANATGSGKRKETTSLLKLKNAQTLGSQAAPL